MVMCNWALPKMKPNIFTIWIMAFNSLLENCYIIIIKNVSRNSFSFHLFRINSSLETYIFIELFSMVSILHIKKIQINTRSTGELTSNLPHEWQVQQQLSPSSYFFLNPIWHGLLQIDSGIPSSESNLNWISEKKDKDEYLYGMNL